MKLNLFHCEIGFLPKPYSVVITWIHGIDLDSCYRLGHMVERTTQGMDLESWYRLGLMVNNCIHDIEKHS